MSDYSDYDDKDEEIRRLENKNNTQRQQLNAKIRKLEHENKILADDNNAKRREIERLRESSVYELKTRKRMIDNLLDDKIKNHGPKRIRAVTDSAKIQLKIGRFSDKFVKQYSKRVLVQNVFWQIAACINECKDEDEDEGENDDTEYLGFYLECEDVNRLSFKVSAELRILSNDDNDCGYYCQRYYDRTFNRNCRERGYDYYMDCAIITDERNGYIVDDAIILEVEFTVQ